MDKCDSTRRSNSYNSFAEYNINMRSLSCSESRHIISDGRIRRHDVLVHQRYHFSAAVNDGRVVRGCIPVPGNHPIICGQDVAIFRHTVQGGPKKVSLIIFAINLSTASQFS